VSALVVCAGTGTDVGKTWVGAAVLAGLRRAGIPVAARKPAQSFDPEDTSPKDADVLAGATGETPETVCPPHRWYPVPMAPPMAADALGKPSFTIADLVDELRWPAPVPDVRWLETAGGVRSPIAADGDCGDLARAVGADLIVLVADAGLGTINAVRLSVGALSGFPVVVVLNRFDTGSDLHRRNRDWLQLQCGFDVVTEPAVLVAKLSC
jgi:dethiobiotin synthetase